MLNQQQNLCYTNNTEKQLQSSNYCYQCEVKLTGDDKAIYMKLVTRSATSFLCMDCLAKELHCTREAIEERVRYFRESGNCVLFR